MKTLAVVILRMATSRLMFRADNNADPSPAVIAATGSGLLIGKRAPPAGCRAAINRQIAASLFYDEHDACAPTRQLRHDPPLRGPFRCRGARSEASRDRFVRLRLGRAGRGAVRDRAAGRFRVFSEEWRDDYRHQSSSSAGLG